MKRRLDKSPFFLYNDTLMASIKVGDRVRSKYSEGTGTVRTYHIASGSPGTHDGLTVDWDSGIRSGIDCRSVEVILPDILTCGQVYRQEQHEQHNWNVGNDHDASREKVWCPGFVFPKHAVVNLFPGDRCRCGNSWPCPEISK